MKGFWQKLERLVADHEVRIDRPRGSSHPRYAEYRYPLDYGYLEDTHGGDGDGIDVWVGSLPERAVSGVVGTVDLEKRDAELKVLLGCTEEEMQVIVDFHQGAAHGAILVRRDEQSDALAGREVESP